MDNEEHRRWLNSLRFSWHEKIPQDPEVRRSAAALSLASHIMHRFNPKKGYAQVSIASAAKELGFSQRQLKRARKLLQRQGWICVCGNRECQQVGSWRANKYTLGGGPEDLILDALKGDDDDTVL